MQRGDYLPISTLVVIVLVLVLIGAVGPGRIHARGDMDLRALSAWWWWSWCCCWWGGS